MIDEKVLKKKLKERMFELSRIRGSGSRDAAIGARIEEIAKTLTVVDGLKEKNGPPLAEKTSISNRLATKILIASIVALETVEHLKEKEIM